jgi:hypothetical protein
MDQYGGGKFKLLKNSPIPNNPPKKAVKEEVVDIIPDVSYLAEIESTLDINAWKTKYAQTQLCV